MKMNKIIAGIIAVCVMGFGVPYVNTVAENNSVITASAEDEADYTVGTYEQLTYKNYGDYIEISSCDKFLTEVVIPSEIEGLPVTSIGFSAFSNSHSLTSVKIPDSVTSIGDGAFWYCYSLESVEIPDSVTIIEGGAFYHCDSLTSINIPDSVTSIGSLAFYECSNLTSIKIPKSVTSIGDEAFARTSWLEEKRKENPLVLVNNILIDGGTCTGDVVIPDGVTRIPTDAFNGCDSLTSVKIPDSVTSIGQYAFYECSSLTSVNIPDGVKNIELFTFRGCSSLTSVKIPDSVTSIDEGAFYECSSLMSINIPDSVTSILEGAFSETLWLEERQKENPLVVVNNILIDGRACKGDVVIPDSTTSIGYEAFSYSQDLTSIKIPESVKIIRRRAFECCNELTSVEISDGVTTIELGAFSICKVLTEVTIPESVTRIEDGAFSCWNLESITILNPDCDIQGYAIMDTATIYGYENSTAQAYAEKYGYNFVSLGKAPQKETATGDMNGDNSVSVADAVLLQSYILGRQELTEEQYKNADLTGDGFVDSFDMVLLRKKIIEDNK